MDRKKSPYENIINNVVKKELIEKKTSLTSTTNQLKTKEYQTDKRIKTTDLVVTSENSGNDATNLKPKIPFKVNLQLISCEQVMIKPSNKIISAALSKLPDTIYDLKKNSWIFRIEDYDFVVDILSKNNFLFEKIPKGTLSIATRKIPNENFPLKGNIYENLLNFQKEAVLFALNRNGRVLLGDDMGLGKTIQALAIAYFYYNEFPLLIISPASLLSNWSEEIIKHLNLDATIVRSQADFGSRISIISYNHATTMSNIITDMKFKVIICDECHSLKSMASKRTRLILPILQMASRLIMISGTPAESRPLELYPIFCALDKSLFPSFYIFGNRYCNGHKIGDFYDYSGCSHAKELSIILEKAFMIRRMKNIVLRDLPKKTRKQVFLEIDNFSNDQDKNFKSDYSNIIQEFAKAAEFKLPAIIKYLEKLSTLDKKIVVFCHHQMLIDGIENFCKEKWIGYIRIDGGTVVNKRQEFVKKFQNLENIKIAILSIKACSTGVTLTAGKIVVFTELYWNPGTLLQAEDRIHRIGQTNDIEIHYLLGKGSVDEHVWPYILKKLTVLESLGIGNEDFDYINDITKNLNQKTLDNFFKL